MNTQSGLDHVQEELSFSAAPGSGGSSRGSAGSDETDTIVVAVEPGTKMVMGVECVVVHDKVTDEEGATVEDMGQIITLDVDAAVPAGSYSGCLVTKDWSAAGLRLSSVIDASRSSSRSDIGQRRTRVTGGRVEPHA